MIWAAFYTNVLFKFVSSVLLNEDALAELKCYKSRMCPASFDKMQSEKISKIYLLAAGHPIAINPPFCVFKNSLNLSLSLA